MAIKLIDGGVCAAQGFKAGGIHVGVKSHKVEKKDVALIVSEVECSAAAVFTKNVVKAAPIHVDKKHLENGKAWAIIANSGNANACAPQGEENAIKMCQAAAQYIGCDPSDVLVSSTGVIGQTINVGVIEEGMPALYAALESSLEASDAAAHAIMTTDTTKKEAAVETTIGGKTVCMGGIAKGSGMIHPNMGTMLCFLTTDCAISPEMIKTALLETVNVSFNRISVDGDTSTNDSCMVLANGMAGNTEIREKGEDYVANYKYEKEWLIPINEPPYYGAKIGGHIFATKCGLRINDQMEVIDKRGAVIPGLYAGWHTAGGANGAFNIAGRPFNGIYGDLGQSFVGGFMAANALVKKLNEEA